jgi:hypothetical protein
MPRPPAGEVSKRLKAKAIRVLADTIDDPGAALYLKVQSARTLLQQQKIEPKDEDEDEFPSGSGGRVVILKPGEKYDPAVHNPDGKVGIVLPAKVVILPSNGRENIAEERRLERLARLAEISIPDDESMPEVAAPPPRKPTGRELLKRLRARRRAEREPNDPRCRDRACA